MVDQLAVLAVLVRQRLLQLDRRRVNLRRPVLLEDAVEGLSAVASRPYIDHLLCQDAQSAHGAAPLRRVRDGWQRCQIAREALLITIEERTQEA